VIPRRATASGISAGAVLAALVLAVPAAPAGAAPDTAAAPVAPKRMFVGCTWERTEPLTTISCGRPFATDGTVTFAQCWRTRPTGAQVVRRVEGDWQRTALRVRVFGDAPACAARFPWKSVVSVPVTRRMLDARQVLRVYVPPTDGRPAMQVQFGVCVIDERSVDPCSA